MNNRETCVFDPIVTGQAPAHIVLQEDDLVAFLDTRPVFPGHTLVVPRHHYRTVDDLPPGVAGRLWDAGARVATAQRAALGAEGTFFGLNDVVSQSVPHVHLHVVPRRPKDGLRGFFWPRQRYPSDEEAAATAAALRRALGTGDGTGRGGAAETARPGSVGDGGVGDGVVVRDAIPDDAAAIAPILAGGAISATESPSDAAPYRDAIAEATGSGPATVLVAEVAGEVVGVCQLLVFRHIQQGGGLCAEIESMHVAESARNRGVGSLLLHAAVARARAAGCYRIQLTSNKVRSDAHRFYLRHGFVNSHEGFKLYL